MNKENMFRAMFLIYLMVALFGFAILAIWRVAYSEGLDLRIAVGLTVVLGLFGLFKIVLISKKAMRNGLTKKGVEVKA